MVFDYKICVCIHEIKGNLYEYQHIRSGNRVESIYLGPVGGKQPWIKGEIGDIKPSYGPRTKKIHEPPLKIDKVTLQQLKDANTQDRKKVVQDIIKVKPIEIPDNKVITYFNGAGEIVDQEYRDENGSVYKLPNIAPIKQREKIYTKASMDHPAKMFTPLAQRIIQDYSEPGDTILDPMGGIGTTAIEASRLGRNGIINEYEKRFVNEAKKNMILLERSGQKIGDVKIIYGDARNIKINKKVDLIITSPPFADILAGGKNDNINKYKHGSAGKYYSTNKTNIGTMKGDEFKTETQKVYSECYKNLKKDGKMIVHQYLRR